MKTVLPMGVLLTLPIALMMGCNKETPTPNVSLTTDAEQTESSQGLGFDHMGVIHNQALDVMYELIIENDATTDFSSTGEYWNYVVEACETTADTEDETLPEDWQESISAYNDMLLDLMNAGRDFINSGNSLMTSTDSYYQIVSQDYDENINDDQRGFLLSIYSAVLLRGAEDNIEALLSDLDIIEDETLTQLEDSEMSIVLGAVSVARHSSQYWSDNLPAWQAALEPDLGDPDISIHWGWVAGADAGAAAYWFGSLWGFGIIPPLTVPYAVGGAIVTAAASLWAVQLTWDL